MQHIQNMYILYDIIRCEENTQTQRNVVQDIRKDECLAASIAHTQSEQSEKNMYKQNILNAKSFSEAYIVKGHTNLYRLSYEP